MIAKYQYSIADIIGVQTAGNLGILTGGKGEQASWRYSRIGWGRLGIVFVLFGWMQPCLLAVKCSFAGNLDVAQGRYSLILLSGFFCVRMLVSFWGRGSEGSVLLKSKRRKLSNVMFLDEIDPDEIPDLYAQCHVGMVALDPRHQTHNIPGKFITYMQSGLPVPGISIRVMIWLV